MLVELLAAQGWDTRRPPNGELLRRHEYKDHPRLADIFRGSHEKPEALLVDRATLSPLAVITTRLTAASLTKAEREVTEEYGSACVAAGYSPLAIALAGTSEDDFAVRVLKYDEPRWVPVTYDGNPISWIPNRADTERLLASDSPAELRPTVPPTEVLAARADEINRLLREAGIKDDGRPSVVGAIMLALWQSKGDIRKDARYILGDINAACSQAFWKASKAALSASLHVEEANTALAVKAKRIASILERLNVTVLTAEHDYLGQLYETFFHYTGGNTIGQYFTPRHVASFMTDLVDVTISDVVLDPACGTGGFLIAAMNRVVREHKLSRSQMVQMVKKKLVGFDKEPVTAALCVTNMILRGDGSTGVRKGDCFTASDYPVGKANVVLMNPPFPHKKTDTLPEDFIKRALEGLKPGGRLAVIVPRSITVKGTKAAWRDSILKHHTLNGVVKLPDELFRPYAKVYSAILLLTKGTPHNPARKVFFSRIENDGLRLKKNMRVPRAGEQLTQTLDAYRKHKQIPGYCGWARIERESGWEPGAYIPPEVHTRAELDDEVSSLTRSQAAFVALNAPELRALKQAVTKKTLQTKPVAGRKALASVTERPGTIGALFDIVYGQGSLHNKETLTPGPCPVISSSGLNNGCYGFFEFDAPLEPPFVSVPSTGSIGEAHVQEWPCGVADDCVILAPKPGVDRALLYVAAAVVRNERWRFNYGRKITPGRIRDFVVPNDAEFLADVKRHIANAESVKACSLQDSALPLADAVREIVRREAAGISGVVAAYMKPDGTEFMLVGPEWTAELSEAGADLASRVQDSLVPGGEPYIAGGYMDGHHQFDGWTMVFP